MECPKKKKIEYCAFIDADIWPAFCAKACKNKQNVDKWRKKIIAQRNKLPPLHEQAVSLGKAVVKQALSGNPKRTEEELKRVKEICNGCEFFIKDKERCRKCGCYMNVKQRWATSNCIIGKW